MALVDVLEHLYWAWMLLISPWGKGDGLIELADHPLFLFLFTISFECRYGRAAEL